MGKSFVYPQNRTFKLNTKDRNVSIIPFLRWPYLSAQCQKLYAVPGLKSNELISSFALVDTHRSTLPIFCDTPYLIGAY